MHEKPSSPHPFIFLKKISQQNAIYEREVQSPRRNRRRRRDESLAHIILNNLWVLMSKVLLPKLLETSTTIHAPHGPSPPNRILWWWYNTHCSFQNSWSPVDDVLNSVPCTGTECQEQKIPRVLLTKRRGHFFWLLLDFEFKEGLARPLNGF